MEIPSLKPLDPTSDHILRTNAQFQPYADNGGTVIAIGGDGYALIASDTRLVDGYQIHTRDQSKLFKVNDKVMLGSTGCWCDALTFSRILEIRSKMYRYDHNQELSVNSVAQLVAIMLYNRRFFPYYVGNIVAGLDENNQGHIYSYDPVGCIEDLKYSATGSSSALVTSFLDNQVAKLNIDNLSPDDYKISVDEALSITKDAFRSAAERDVKCGDGVHICIITKDGIKEERINLRRD